VWDICLQVGKDSLLLECEFLHDRGCTDGDFQLATPNAPWARIAEQQIAYGVLPGGPDFAVGLASAVSTGGDQLREHITDLLGSASVVTTLLAFAACGEVNGSVGGVCHSVIRG
jgi:hypothetical protein